MNDRISGTGHGNQINGMKVVKNVLYTCGIDDTLRQVDLGTYAYNNIHDIKLGSQPRGMDINGDRVVIVTVKEVRKKFIQCFFFKNTISYNCIIESFVSCS